MENWKLQRIREVMTVQPDISLNLDLWDLKESLSEPGFMGFEGL
jgi:hypothetical protein